MTPKQRREYWLKTERIRIKQEAKWSGKIQKVLKKHMASYNNISDTMMQTWNVELLEIYNDMFRETFREFARLTYNSMKGQKFVGMGVNEVWTQVVNDWLTRYGLQMVSTISGNSRDLLLSIVNNAIQEGVEQGLGQDAVAKLIQDRLEDERYTFTRFRAQRIARTETNRAANFGHMEGAKALPFEVMKEWISARDKRTRRVPDDQHDHWNLDGKKVEFEEDFLSLDKFGNEVRASHPGDVTAPAGFTINCRCRVAFEPKRDRNGRLIRRTNDIQLQTFRP